MKLQIDHVTLAASRVESLANAFAAVGMGTDYGGPHSNGVTHMSLVSFDDGSYIELISVMRPGQPAPKWNDHIVHEGGPCAWAVRTDDLEAETGRLRELGVTVGDAVYMERNRPDGQVVQWHVAPVGDHGVGAMHPFIIEDTTPRELRVPASESVTGSELTGIERVILGVPSIEAAAETFRRDYGLAPPVVTDTANGAIRSAVFEGEVVVLVEPTSDAGWLAERLALFGPTPCGFLIGSRDLAASGERSRIGAVEQWGDSRVAWFDGDPLIGRWLGVVAVDR